MREAIDIPIGDITAALDALPNRTRGVVVTWTEKEDEDLLKYWPLKNHNDIAKILGKSRYACEQRYRAIS